MKLANQVYQFTTSTGTGNLTLASETSDNPVQYFRNFADAVGTGSTKVFPYNIRHRSAAEFEVGRGYMNDANTLVRLAIIDSSNGGAAVNFSAGTKDVLLDVPAQYQVTTEFLGGEFFNLDVRTNAATPNTQLDINADKVIIFDQNGLNPMVLESVDITIDATTTGENGLQSGTIQAATTYYAFIIVKTDGKKAGFMHTSQTITLPSGYTHAILCNANI